MAVKHRTYEVMRLIGRQVVLAQGDGPESVPLD